MKISELLVIIIYSTIQISYINTAITQDLVFFSIIFISLNKIKHTFNALVINSKKYEYYGLILSISFIIIFITYNYIALYSIIYENIENYYLSSISLFLFFILLLMIEHRLKKYFIQKIKINEELNKLALQKKYIENLEKNNNEIRRFKHDFNNIILGLEGYIKEENIDIPKLKEYFYSNLMEFNNKVKVDNITLAILSNIKVYSLKNLITNKIISAQYNNITVKLTIEGTITNVYTNEMNLTRVIGILLDNALEACIENSKNKYLEINILRIDKTIDFQILNTFKNNKISIERIYEEGYSTKGDHRGMGLTSAKEIVDQYNMILNTKIEDNIFKQFLTIEGEYYNEDIYLRR